MLITKEWQDEEGGGSFLLPPGMYNFKIAAAEKGKSQAGNDKLTLTLHVYDGDGGAPVFVYDYLTSAFKKRVIDFCRCVGLVDLVDGGDLTPQRCINATGQVHLKQETYESVTRNKVDRYEYDKTISKVPEEDDIPF